MNTLLKNKYMHALLVLAGIYLPSHSAPVGVVQWPPITDVTDQPINIIKDGRMHPGTTTVVAGSVQNLNITLAQDVAISGNECANCALRLVTFFGENTPGTVINFDVTEFNLSFLGKSKHHTFSLEKLEGNDVMYTIANGKELTFKLSH